MSKYDTTFFILLQIEGAHFSHTNQYYSSHRYPKILGDVVIIATTGCHVINDVIIYLRIFYFLGKNEVNQYYKNAHGAVDVLIGLDCADLHFSFKDVRGKPGQPVARLTPLGWTCIGAMEGQSQDNIRTNCSRMYACL